MKRKTILLALIAAVIVLVIAGLVLWGRGKISQLFTKLQLTKVPFVEKIMKKPAEIPAEMKKELMPEEEIMVKVYRVAKKPFEDTLPALGTVKGFREINLKFEIAGIIESFNFREGDEIKEGDIIAALNQKDALLKLKYNEIEVEKYKKLYEIGSIAKMKLDQSELEHESAKNDLEKTYLYAPRDGVLGSRDVEVGEYVTSNDKIATLIDNLDVFVEVGIIEKDIGRIKVGAEAKVFVDTYPDKEFQGVVDNIAPVVEGRSRTQTVKVRVRNDDGSLLPGMFTRTLVAIYSTDSALVVPSVVLNKAEKGYVVFVINESESEKKGDEGAISYGIAEERPVEFEYRSSDYAVIKKGLREHEPIVVETQEKLKDKAKVIISEVQEQML